MPLPHLKSSLLPSGATPDPPEPSRWDKEGWDKAGFGGDSNDEIIVHLVTTEVVHSCTMIQRKPNRRIGTPGKGKVSQRRSLSSNKVGTLDNEDQGSGGQNR